MMSKSDPTWRGDSGLDTAWASRSHIWTYGANYWIHSSDNCLQRQCVNWQNYIIAFEYAQHHPVFPLGPGPPAQWLSELFPVQIGPEPEVVIGPQTIYTEHPVPIIGANLPEVPARIRGPLLAGATDVFFQAFIIDAPGAFPGTNLFTFLTQAQATGADIHWARSSSQGVSQYPEPLGTLDPSLPGNVLTPFDNILPGMPVPVPPRPGSFSNVSVFVIPAAEPSTIVLLGSGILVLAIMARKGLIDKT